VTPAQVFGRRVREARVRLGLTQQALVDRLAERGLPMDRSTLVKLERGQGAPAPLDKVFALAAALEVPPVHLIIPLEDEAPVAITPNTTVSARHARAWLRGSAALPDAGVNLAEIPRSELRRLVERQLTRGMNQLMRALVADRTEAEVERIVDQILNRDREEPDDGQPASTS
jgi:transcriptional regulator with XRE-family HTH domain